MFSRTCLVTGLEVWRRLHWKASSSFCFPLYFLKVCYGAMAIHKALLYGLIFGSISS